MTKVIWKAKLTPVPLQIITVPHGAKMLIAREQLIGANLTPCVWYECDPEQPEEPRHIVMLGTGHRYEGDSGRYLGVCILDEGALVLHVFEPEHGSK